MLVQLSDTARTFRHESELNQQGSISLSYE